MVWNEQQWLQQYRSTSKPKKPKAKRRDTLDPMTLSDPLSRLVLQPRIKPEEPREQRQEDVQQENGEQRQEEEEAFYFVKPDADIGVQPQQIPQGDQGDQQKSGDQGDQGDQQKSGDQGEQKIEDLEGKPPAVGEMDTVMTERGLKSPFHWKSYEHLRGCAEFNNKAPLWNLFDRQTNDTKKRIIDNLIAQKIIKVGAKKPEFGIWAKFKKFIGKDALDWNKFSAVCRQTIQSVKEAGKGGTGTETGGSGGSGGEEKGTYDTVAGYADMGKTGAKLGLSVASAGLDKFGQKVVDSKNNLKQVNASTALAQSEGMSIDGVGSGTMKGMLGMSTASNSLGIVGNIKTAVDDVRAIGDKDTDKMTTAADTARGVSNLAEMSSNTANLARAAGDLSTGKIGGAVSNAALTQAVGIGAIVGGGAKLTQGILNTIQTSKHIDSLEGVMSGTKNDQMRSAADQAKFAEEQKRRVGIGDIAQGATMIVGGSLVLALGISNPIGLAILAVAGVFAGIVAAVNWWKGANRTRKLIDEHQTFGPEVKGMKSKFDEQAAKYDQEQKAYDQQVAAEREGMGWWDSLKTRFSKKDMKAQPPKKPELVENVQKETGIGDRLLGALVGGKENSKEMEVFRRITVQKHGFSDIDDYSSFHQTTTAEYLHGLLRQGTTEEARQTPDWQEAQKVVLGLGLKVDPKLFEIDEKQKPPVVRKGIPEMARIKKSL